MTPNAQGTGSSIVETLPRGGARVFAMVPRPIRAPTVCPLTAPVALRFGYAIGATCVDNRSQ